MHLPTGSPRLFRTGEKYIPGRETFIRIRKCIRTKERERERVFDKVEMRGSVEREEKKEKK